MLHLKVPIRSGTCFGEIEYENPLQKTKEEYYTCRLHSVYASAAETKTVETPLTITIQDSSYIASINSDEIDFNSSIKDYSQKIANLLSGSVSSVSRGSRRFIKTLKNYSPNPPSASYTEATDNDLNARFFNLLLPKRTFLYCNNLAPLYALGYADDQIEHIANLLEYSDIPKEIIEQSQVFGPHTDLNSIYVVVDNTTESLLPVAANEGRLKWLSDDKFESVYFPHKRQERYIESADIPRERIHLRNKRQAVLEVKLLQKELDNEIHDDDTKQSKLSKLDILKRWDTQATQVIVSKPGPGKPFNQSDLLPQDGETGEKAKLRYWRQKIVNSVVSLSQNSGVPEIIVPPHFYGIYADEFLVPVKTLGDMDPKSYVKIGANAALISFYNGYLAMIDKQLKNNPSLSDTFTQSLKTTVDKYTAEHTNRFRIQGETIATAAAAKKRFEKAIKEDVGVGPTKKGAKISDPSGEGLPAHGTVDSGEAVNAVSEDEEVAEGEKGQEEGPIVTKWLPPEISPSDAA